MAIKKRYIAPLDGLRTLAVLAVILYHTEASFFGITFNGGLLGVTVFFVLSGYLITGILYTELCEYRTIRLKRFWTRRVRRLFPAIALVVVVTILLCVLLNHKLLTKLRPDIVPSLFWFQNWWYILRDLSYFDNLGAPSPLVHFWSLAIEEQFYLVWPLILLAGYKLGARRKVIRRACLVLALVSVVVLEVLYSPQSDPTRVYYGTDTRAFSLLLGAWLSLVWPGQALTEESTAHTPKSAVRILDGVGAIGLLVLVLMMTLIKQDTGEFMFRAGLIIASVATALLIACLVHPRTLLAKFFALPPLVWIGQRSYGIYLWHFPIILLAEGLDPASDGHTWWIMLLAVAVTVAAAALSYTFVENPIRHGAIGDFINRVRQEGFPVLEFKRLQVIVPSAVCGVLLLITVVGCTVVPDEDYVPQDAIVSTGTSIDSGMDVTPVEEDDNDNDEESSDNGPVHEKGKFNPVLIGDSVPGDTNEYFEKAFPYGLNDSVISRWFYQARSVYEDYKEQDVVGHVVVFANFSNFELGDGELKKMLDLVGTDKEIFLVNVEIPETFESDTNNKLYDFANKHDNVHLIDWNATCDGHKGEYLWDDETHLRPEGAKIYIQLILDSIKDYLPKKDWKALD